MEFVNISGPISQLEGFIVENPLFTVYMPKECSSLNSFAGQEIKIKHNDTLFETTYKVPFTDFKSVMNLMEDVYQYLKENTDFIVGHPPF